MHVQDRLISFVLTVVVAVLVGVLLYMVLIDYTRLADMTTYRLAYHVAHGEGVVFNAAESAWPTVSPLWPILLGGFVRVAEALSGTVGPESVVVPQNFYDLFLSGLGAAIYGLLASSIFYLLRNEGHCRPEALVIIALFVIGQPLWLGMRSAAPLTLLLILNAYHALKDKRWHLAGLLAGAAMLAQPTGIIGALILGVWAFRQERAWRYWQTVWIPLVAWVIYSAMTYAVLLDGLLAHQQAIIGDPAQTLLWITVLVAVVWFIHSAWVALLAVWAATDIALSVLILGDLPVIESPVLVLVLSVLLGRWIVQRQWQAVPLLAVWIGVYLAFPLQIDPALETDLELSETIYVPERASLLHDRSDMIIRHLEDFTANVYRFDGVHSPQVREFADADDYESMIVALAPEFIYVNEATLNEIGLDLRSETLEPLRYRREIDVQRDPGQREGDQFWFRDREIGTFGDTITAEHDINPDIHLDSYAIDRDRFTPGQPLRLRLDWQLADYPRYPIGLQINLLDINGSPLATIFPTYEATTWSRDSFSTYHALLVPADTLPQVATISVAVDYRAAIVGSTRLGSVVIASDEIPPDDINGRINNAILYEASVTQEANTLQVRLMWGVTAPLERDYQVFVHLIPVDNVQPAATGDSAPVGGRFPTSTWRPGDVVIDPHVVYLDSVPPGQYTLNVGFYLLDTFERLRDDNSDSLTVARLVIDAEGGVKIQPVQ